jgi:hypothetical protein
MLFLGFNSSNQFVIGHGLFEGTLGASKFNTIPGSSISIVVSMFQNLYCLLNSHGKDKKLTFCNFFMHQVLATLVVHQFLLLYVQILKGFKSLFEFLLLENQQKRRGRNVIFKGHSKTCGLPNFHGKTCSGSCMGNSHGAL